MMRLSELHVFSRPMAEALNDCGFAGPTAGDGVWLYEAVVEAEMEVDDGDDGMEENAALRLLLAAAVPRSALVVRFRSEGRGGDNLRFVQMTLSSL